MLDLRDIAKKKRAQNRAKPKLAQKKKKKCKKKFDIEQDFWSIALVAREHSLLDLSIRIQESESEYLL